MLREKDLAGSIQKGYGRCAIPIFQRIRKRRIVHKNDPNTCQCASASSSFRWEFIGRASATYASTGNFSGAFMKLHMGKGKQDRSWKQDKGGGDRGAGFSPHSWEREW